MTEPSKNIADTDDPFQGRQPTSHERMTGLPWDASYDAARNGGPAPWDIGHPQPAIVRLVSAGGFAGGGPVLDAGCGTGENARHIALHTGLPVLGVDVAETALAMARKRAEAKSKSDDRAAQVEFALADAFHLERLGRTFQTVLDCGLFHTFESDSDDGDPNKASAERRRYVASLASVIKRGGTLYVLCFGDEGPDIGPHPASQQDLRAAFNSATGWKIVSLELERIQTRFHGESGVSAWLATIKPI